MSDQTLPQSQSTAPTTIPTQAGPPEAEFAPSSEGESATSSPSRSTVKRDKVALIGSFGAGVLVLGIVWAAFGGLFGSGSFTLNGKMTLMQSSSSYSSSSYSSSAYYLGADGTCYGDGGYSDIDAGAAVNVYNAAGAIVAVGRLTAGTGDYSGCTLSFSVPDVPGGQDFYQVEVSHRGKINLTDAEARAGTAAFTLGG